MNEEKTLESVIEDLVSLAEYVREQAVMINTLENNLERLVAYINIRFSEITEGFCRREENTLNHLKELEEHIEKISFEYDRNADE